MGALVFPSTTTDTRGNEHILRRVRIRRNGQKTGHYAAIITTEAGEKVRSTIILFEVQKPRIHASQPKPKASSGTFWLSGLFSRQTAAVY